MESMRVGGLVSGLDTNAIIDNLMTTAKEPINRMNEKIDLLTWEQTQYNDIITALSDLKSALLPLKMESTFKSKQAVSTYPNIAEAIASVNTPPGTYNLKVEQTAEPSYAISTYTSYAMIKTGAGIESLSSTTKYQHNKIEGLHTVNIKKESDSVWTAADVFTSKSGEKFSKMTGSAMDTGVSALVNPNGELSRAAQKTTLSFVFTYNGEEKSATINVDYSAGTSINAIAQDLEKQINAEIDKTIFKDESQSIVVRIDRDKATGMFSFGFYDVTKDAKIKIVGFCDANYDPANPDATNTSYATSLAKKLGIYAGKINQPVLTTEMTNVIVSNNETNLATKIKNKDGGIIMGAEFKISSSGLKEGTFSINQDISANNRVASKSTLTGADFKKITADTKQEEIEAWLKTPLGTEKNTNDDKDKKPLTRNFFDDKKQPSKSTNGYFHINGVKIEIYDYTKLTPMDFIGLINGSGAGVKASFDTEKHVFKIENTQGAGEIAIGQTGDTSDILSIMHLSIPSGAIYTKGTTEGTTDTSAKLASADRGGLTTPVTSGIFTVNGISIYVDKDTDSVDSVMKKINNSGAGVTINYDSNTDKFSLSGIGTKKIKLGGTNDTSNFLEALNLTYDTKKEIEVGIEGKNAIFTLNNTKYTRESNVISDAVAGMAITLSDAGTTTINVTIDPTKAIDAIADFAAKYNTIVNKLSPTEPSKQDKEKYADALTDDKKKDMSEDDIKTYETNHNRIQYYEMVSKSSELRYLKRNMRSNIMNELTLSGNKFKSLSELGVIIAGSDTRDTNVTKRGFLFDLSMDKTELAKYIKEHTDFASTVTSYSDDVYKFFSENTEVKISKDTGKVITDSNSKEAYTTITYTGWARRYDTFLTNNTSVTSGLYKKAGTNGTLDSQISSLKKQIDTQTLRAESYLERMWSQFAAMEERVQNIQTQASYLTQIGSGSSS